MGAADSDIKAAFRSAHNRGLKRQNPQDELLVPASPVASLLDLPVESRIDEVELKKRIREFEAKKPGFMVASYKGCCLVHLTSPFPKFYKKTLESLLTPAQKKTLGSRYGFES